MLHPLTNGYRTCPCSAETHDIDPQSTIYAKAVSWLGEAMKAALLGSVWAWVMIRVATWAGY